jgi:hypothetical protein
MSRGGIGKSKKQPPAPPPKRGRSREPRVRRERVRIEQVPRPGLAALIGSVLLGASSFLLIVGVVLGEEGQSTLSLGVVTLPLGFASVAMLSQRLPIITSTLFAFLAAVGSTAVLVAVISFTGFVVLIAPVTVGVGLGTMLTLLRPEGSSRNARLMAVGVVAIFTLVAELVAPLIALLGPFLVVVAVHRIDSRLGAAAVAASEA